MDEPDFSRTERYRLPGVEEEPQYDAALHIWKELCRAKGRWTRQSHYCQSSAVLIITCLGERDGCRIPYQMALNPNDIDKLPEDIRAFCPMGPHWLAGLGGGIRVGDGVSKAGVWR